MKKSTTRHLFAKAVWRRWLETLRQWEQAMDYDDIDLLERRIRRLELQVADLRSKVGSA